MPFKAMRRHHYWTVDTRYLTHTLDEGKIYKREIDRRQARQSYMETGFNRHRRMVDRYRQAGLEYALSLFESTDLGDLLRQVRIFAEQVRLRFVEVA